MANTTIKETWIQNKEPHIINIGEDIKLKPGFPQKIKNLDELKELYPMLKEKISKGLIIILDDKTAKKEGRASREYNYGAAEEQEVAKRLKNANMV